MEQLQRPQITQIEWGRIDVGPSLSFRDAKLFPDGVRAWDWGETGTRHVPGIQVADVEELLEHGCSTVILSRGMDLVLQVPAATVAWLERHGIRVEVLQSREAVARYNDLCAHEAVGALIHSTC